MSEIPIEINIISGLLGRGLIHPGQYLDFVFNAKSNFGLFGFKGRLAIFFNDRTDRG